MTRITRLLLPFQLSLLISLVESATLVCQEPSEESAGSSKNKLNCQLDIPLEEVAEAWNFNCQPATEDNGLSCQFELDRDKFKDGSTVFTPIESLVTACTKVDNDGICLKTETFSKIEITSGDNAAKKVKQEVNGETKSAEEGKADKEGIDTGDNSATATATAMEQQPLQPEQPTDSGVQIGNYKYLEPYNQYAPPIAQVLQTQHHLWQTPPSDLAVEYAFANAHLELGIAHFTSVENENNSPGLYTAMGKIHEDSFDLTLAVQAFEQGERIYQRILQQYKGSDQETVVHSSLAALHLQWGEVYQSVYFYDPSLNVEEMTEEEESFKYNQQALEQFEKAETHYRLCMETTPDDVKYDGTGDPTIITDTHLTLAHVLARVARCLTNSIQGSVNPVIAEEFDLEALMNNGENGDGPSFGTSSSLPQLEMLTRILPKAQEKYAEAVRVYRATISQLDDYKDQQLEIKKFLATTLQDYGTTASYASNTPLAIELQEESVALCQEILEALPEGNPDRYFMISYVAGGLYGLASHYMQLGKYDDTSARYRAAMDWYETYDLEPANVVAGFEVPEETMEAYEKQLEEYHELLREIDMPDGYPEEQAQYGPNHAYEADLHAAMGSAHLSRDQMLLAIDHFNQAIQLYEKDYSGENLSRSIADVKVNLAAAYFQDSQFKMSGQAHAEAMAIYREVVGEGKNPMLAGLAEKLGMNIEDLAQANNLATGDLFGSQELEDMIDGLDLDESLKASLHALTKSLKNGKEESKETQKTATTHDDQNKENKHDQDKDKAKQNVHEELIDPEILEQIRHAILNASSVAEEL